MSNASHNLRELERAEHQLESADYHRREALKRAERFREWGDMNQCAVATGEAAELAVNIEALQAQVAAIEAALEAGGDDE